MARFSFIAFLELGYFFVCLAELFRVRRSVLRAPSSQEFKRSSVDGSAERRCGGDSSAVMSSDALDMGGDELVVIDPKTMRTGAAA